MFKSGLIPHIFFFLFSFFFFFFASSFPIFATCCQLSLCHKPSHKNKHTGNLVHYILKIPTIYGGATWILVFNTCATRETKASELVPCSLLPHWNSMRFFATVSLYDSNSMDEVKFATLYRQSSNMLLCCDDVTYVPALWNFQKADLEPYLYGKKYTTFSFPIHGAFASNVCLRDAPTYSCIQLYT